MSLGDRARRLVDEVVGFLAVGGLATFVSILGFNVLVHGVLIGVAPLHDQPIPAYVVVNAVAGYLAYLGLRWWAFSHREVVGPIRSVALFFGLGALTMLIPVLCLAVSRYLLGLSDPLSDNVSANILGLGLSTVARFWLFRRYVFLDAGSPPRPGGP